MTVQLVFCFVFNDPASPQFYTLSLHDALPISFQRWFGFQPNTKVATLIFGLLHGFGLATKIQEYEISPDGLIPNLIAFNVGVEIGQLLALSAILILMGYWRHTGSFWRHAYTANVAMMSAGFLLMGYQITGLFVSA